MKLRNTTHINFNWKVIFTVSLASLLAACSPTLNTGKLEDEIQKGIEEQTNINVSSISCPTNVELEEGDIFDCEVEASDETKFTVTVTQQDDEGNVTWKQNPVSAASNNNDDTDSSDSTDSPGDLLPTEDPPSPEPEPEPTPSNVDPNAPRLDSSIVESTIKEQFADQAGIPVRSVACPQNVAINVGSKFNCTVKATNGKTIEAVVTQTNEQGGFSWNATSGLISYDKVEGLIKTGLQDQENLTVTPSCGTSQTRYIIAYSGEKFSCSATDPNGRKIPITVSVQSDDGQVVVNWKL